MDQSCETCGQKLPGDLPIRGRLTGAPRTTGGVLDVELTPDSYQPPTEQPAAQASPNRRGRSVLLGIIVAVVVGLFLLSSNDSPTPLAGSTGDDGSRNAIDDQLGSDTPSTSGPFDRNEPFAEPEIVDAQSAALAELIGSNRLAYLAANGIVVVDLEAGVAPTAEFAPESFDQFGDLAELSGFELLSEADTTYGIRKGDELSVHRFSNSGRLVPTGEDGIFSITSDPDATWERLFVATSAGFFMADLEVPVGSKYVNIPELGTLVSPPSGNTVLAGIRGYEPYSDHRVVAGTPTFQVEIRCEDGFVCHPHLVNRDTGENEQVPDEFAGDTGTVSVSPDGRWILRTGSDDDVAFDADTGSFSRLDDRPKGSIVWAPDSSFAVWFDPLTNEPLLQVLYPERRASETIDLSELGAADRAGDDVLVFS